ncbi:Rmf/CrpP family protein [Aureimonas psammosilenae]|uniref:Rmf/CrpP family protein n=1 Tax=Aureimonas psammosilenae TaxID=2495496 RepID=UPI0012609F81|nr:Rmf/CrpP family protein [Aureimonas psammosilenae]
MTTGTSPFEQGKLAFKHNHPMSSCDFPVGSGVREEWMRGWTEARNASPVGDGQETQAGNSHPGMMGDGTEEQNLNQKGDPSARISEKDVNAAFGKH